MEENFFGYMINFVKLPILIWCRIWLLRPRINNREEVCAPHKGVELIKLTNEIMPQLWQACTMVIVKRAEMRLAVQTLATQMA